MKLKEAKQLKLRTYDEGRVCKIHGQTDRYVNNSSCVECSKEYHAISRTNQDKSKINADGRRRYANITTIEKWIHIPLIGCKRRAAEKQLPFNLDRGYLTSIWTDNCPVFGIPLLWKGKRGVNPDNMATVDRIIPSKGYVKGNVCFISHLANRIKNSANSTQIQQVANWLKTQEQLLLNQKSE